MTQLQDRSMELESLCKARRAEAWERSQTYLIFQEKYTEVSVAWKLKWYRWIGMHLMLEVKKTH